MKRIYDLTDPKYFHSSNKKRSPYLWGFFAREVHSFAAVIPSPLKWRITQICYHLRLHFSYEPWLPDGLLSTRSRAHYQRFLALQEHLKYGSITWKEWASSRQRVHTSV